LIEELNNYKPIKTKKMAKDVVTKPSKFAIVNKAMASLNIGDYGKIEGFVSRTADILKREAESATRSITNAKHKHTAALVVLNEELEDAKEGVEEAYCDLHPEKLKDHASQRAFREEYLSTIDAAESVVLGIEDKIEAAKEAYKVKIAGYKEQVTVRETRITRLTKGIVK
jgi:hypothetical protein